MKDRINKDRVANPDIVVLHFSVSHFSLFSLIFILRTLCGYSVENTMYSGMYRVTSHMPNASARHEINMFRL
jgi:hypothetical protein